LATFVQWPSELCSAQLWQAPVQALSQHTPSTHWFDRHCDPPAQGEPMGFLPHERFMHVLGATQSVSDVQSLTQASFEQANGAHSICPGCWQVPRPSQVPAVFSMLPLQLGGMQVESAGNRLHAPKPSHKPVVPQVDLFFAGHLSSGNPSPSGRHCPTASGWLHETHSPSQGTLQHTPSTQLLDEQSSLTLQARPLGSVPQLLPTHWWPALQSPSVVQDDGHLSPAHAYGAQLTAGPGPQFPFPSQIFTPAIPSPSQVPEKHIVPRTCVRQPPLPSQVPSRPHDDSGSAVHWLAIRGFTPAGSSSQDPSLPGRLQA